MQIKVVTYNIHRAIGVDRRFRPERVVQILRHYNADLVMLQEVDDGAPRSRELDLAKELAQDAGYPYFAVGHNVSLRKGRYGNATLSRFPILRERNIDLSIGSWLIRRGCQHTTLDLSTGKVGKDGRIAAPGIDRRLEVFNLHLGLSARERHKQVEMLMHSDELSSLDGDTPVLVAGDFNDWRSLLWPVFTNGLGFRCATDRKRGPYRVIPTYPSFSPQGGLDRIYFRGPLRLSWVQTCRMQVSRLTSDHLPVIAEFTLDA
ncbi:MAG TPA: endonuclease/exonuclease/phosphatase family protein [Thermoanaerobaculia bacterium]|jgi:endonuclease/exonuclease/phosphatase family metal-dependent hydrolase|nr:endonuclease/exonuclease/phosphatase family protein [Thermoanaerobaculia bacterium]